MSSDRTMLPASVVATTPSDMPIPSGYTSASSIFAPTNDSTTASPYLSRWNLEMTPASTKYIDRSPRMANTFDV